MSAVVALIKPVLFSFLASKAVKDLVVELLRKYAKTTDNQIDDTLVEVVAQKLYTHQ